MYIYYIYGNAEELTRHLDGFLGLINLENFPSQVH